MTTSPDQCCTRGLGYSIHPFFTGSGSISFPLSLKGGFYLAFSARLGITLYLLEYLSTPDVMTLTLRMLRLWKIPIQQDLVKMHFLLSSRSYPGSENSNVKTISLDVQGFQKGPVITYKGSQVPSVFLLYTGLHVSHVN